MPNLNKYGKSSPRGRIAAGVIVVGLLVAVVVFGSGACDDGNDDREANSPRTSTTTSMSTDYYYRAPLPTCEEQGMVRDPEHSDTSVKRSCASQQELDGRNTLRQEHNDTLAAANAELVQTVRNSRDQLVALMSNFCRSPLRNTGPQQLVNEPYPASLVSYFEQAKQLWEGYWFPDNIWLTTYDFSGAVARICGQSTNPSNIPAWKRGGYTSKEECLLDRPVRGC